jgi:hypothetical protein
MYPRLLPRLVEPCLGGIVLPAQARQVATHEQARQSIVGCPGASIGLVGGMECQLSLRILATKRPARASRSYSAPISRRGGGCSETVPAIIVSRSGPTAWGRSASSAGRPAAPQRARPSATPRAEAAGPRTGSGNRRRRRRPRGTRGPPLACAARWRGAATRSTCRSRRGSDELTDVRVGPRVANPGLDLRDPVASLNDGQILMKLRLLLGDQRARRIARRTDLAPAHGGQGQRFLDRGAGHRSSVSSSAARSEFAISSRTVACSDRSRRIAAVRAHQVVGRPERLERRSAERDAAPASIRPAGTGCSHAG